MVDTLDKIFGPNWHQLDQTVSGNGFDAILFELMGAFNGIVLASVAVLIFYVIAVGVIGTASEGEPLGKRYSTLWTPLRVSLLILLKLSRSMLRW